MILSRLKQIISNLLVKPVRSYYEITLWKAQNRPFPPPHSYKLMVVREYSKRINTCILVETGTYQGEMVDAMKGIFHRIISIELDETLFKNAKIRFSQYPQISILKGDSGKLLPEVLSTIDEPCLFWLDGHYSGGFTARGKKGTPILEEITAILNSSLDEIIILIDDARDFNGHDDYPTIEELQKLVEQKRTGWKFEICDNIIRIHK